MNKEQQFKKKTYFFFAKENIKIENKLFNKPDEFL